MGLFESIGKVLEPRLQIAAPGVISATSVTGTDWSVAKSGSDIQQLKAYQSWTYAAASVIARASAMVDGHLLRGEDEVEVHPFLDLWAKPCRAWNGTQWREIWFLHRLLAGNSYNEVVAAGRIPVELWPMRPDAIEVVPSKTDFIKGYRYTGSAGQVTLEPEQVIHSKRANPHSNYYGLSVVQAAAQAVDLSQMYKGYALASLRNGATPKSVVILRENIEPGQAQAVEAMVGDAFKGVANAGRTAVISKAIEDVKMIQMTPAEMDFLAGQGFSRDETFAVFGVHRSKVGMADDINRANAEAADYTFKADVVAPEVGAMEDMINSDLLPRYGESGLKWKFDNPVPEDRDRALAEAQAIYREGIGIQNEAREKLGLDERPEGERYAKSFSVNWVPAGQVEEPAPAKPVAVPAAASIERASFTGQARAVGQLVAQHQNQIRSAMDSYFASQRRRVTGRLRNELASWPAPTTSQWWKASPEVRSEFVSVLAGWKVERARAGVDEPDERERLIDLLVPLLLAAAASGYLYVKRLTNKNPGGDPDSLARERAELVAGIITDTTVGQLLAAITGAASKEAALAAVEAVFDRAISQRAPLIGRVEASTMVNSAARLGLQTAGYAYKQWQTVGDDLVEEECQANSDEGAIPIDGVFQSGDTEPPTGVHPNCRCVLVPAMAEDVGVTPIDLDELPEAARL